MAFADDVADFLAQKRIAVAGVSRQGGLPANAIFRKLRGAEREVFPVNPAAETVEGVPCYPDLKSIPGGVDALVIAAPPVAAPDLVRQCVGLGVRRVWMHRSVGTGSYSAEAEQAGRAAGLTVIAGGCPLMFVPPVDFWHSCLKCVLRWTGGLPK